MFVGALQIDDIKKCSQAARWTTNGKLYAHEDNNCIIYDVVEGDFVLHNDNIFTMGCVNNKDPAKNCESD